jgi:hypothetical protein
MRSLHINRYSMKATTNKQKCQRKLHDLTQIWVFKNSLNWYCTFNFTHTNHGIANAFNGLMILEIFI